MSSEKTTRLGLDPRRVSKRRGREKEEEGVGEKEEEGVESTFVIWRRFLQLRLPFGGTFDLSSCAR